MLRAQDFIAEYQDIMRTLKNNIQIAQNQQKKYVDQRRVERSFQEGDMVYVRLQPYKQSSLKKSGSKKLKPCFYGPFKVLRKIDEVAYALELPNESSIHNVFHVPCLKKGIGTAVTTIFRVASFG